MPSSSTSAASTPSVSSRPAAPPLPALPGTGTDWDAIVVNSSAGKDSQATLDVVAAAAAAAGVLDRVTVLHCDLGDVEWPGVPELAAAQAAHYGVRFEVRRREQNGLLDLVHDRGRWMSGRARYCTSATKRAPARRMLTELVNELNLDRPARILNCLGLRAAESPARARKDAFALDDAASNVTRRRVWTWLPIHDWTDAQVWDTIAASGAPHHRAYDLGMRRLSCVLCPLAARADLVRACQLRPGLARTYIDVETAISHDFRPGLSLREVYAEAAATAGPNDPITTGTDLGPSGWWTL